MDRHTVRESELPLSELETLDEPGEEYLAQTLAALLLELIQGWIADGTWKSETGVVGLTDTLEDTWIHARKNA